MSKFSVKKPFTVLVCVVLTLVLGVVAYMKMSTDLLPNINLPYVIIMTTYVGASPETVEMTVTAPVESSMATVSNIEGINSISAENYSVVILEFAQTADMDSVSLEIRENLDQLKSYWDDSVGSPIIMKLNPDMLPIMIAAVGVEGMDEYEVGDFATDKVVPELESIEGVASVSTTGIVEQSVHAVIREDKIEKVNQKIKDTIAESFADGLAQVEEGLEQIAAKEEEIDLAVAAGLMKSEEASAAKVEMAATKEGLLATKASIEEAQSATMETVDMSSVLTTDLVSNILTAQNFSMPAGYVEDGETTYLVRVGDKPSTIDELSALPVMTVPGTDKVITVGEVCDVFYTDNKDSVYTNVNGEHGIMLTMQKQTGYSTGDVSKAINEKFDDLREEYDNISLVALMDQGIYIDLIVRSIIQNVLVGAVLAVIILIIFLRDIRPTFVIAISIPVSLIAAIVCMYFAGVTLNVISLSGLALGVGMLVDNSIVVIENIYRLRNEGMERRRAAVEGAKEVAGAIIASTLTTVCVFLPIVFTEGITRQLFVDMGLTIAFSLMASLLVALTVVPALAAGVLKTVKVTKQQENKGFKYHYGKFLRNSLRFKWLVLLLAVAFLAGSVYLAYQRGTAFFPDMASPQVTVTVTPAEDWDLTDVTNETNELVTRLMTMPDVIDVGAMSSSTTLSLLGGMAGSNGSDGPVTSATIYITTTEDRKMSSDELESEIKKRAEGIEGIAVSVETATMDMSALGGSGITLEIKGRELDTLYSMAEEAAEILRNTEGVEDVVSAVDDADPEFRIVVDKEKAIAHNLTVAQVFAAVYPKLQDASVATKLSTARNDISVYVEDENLLDFTRRDLKRMTIATKDGDGNDVNVKLSDVVEFKEAKGFNTIRRSAQTRYITVTATLKDGYNIGLVSQDATENMKALNVPAGYSAEFNGENEMIMEALKQLVLMLLLAVIFIYLIMVAQFQSLSSPFIIMFTIPLAFTGGFLALFVSGNEISIISMIGFIMLSGIIVNNGIVLVDYINQRRAAGLEKTDAIVEAGVTRLRPVLMTALTTILALFGMVFSKEMGADMARPLAIVVIGGMIYGTLMTLVVVPCIYDLLTGKKYKNRDYELENSDEKAAGLPADSTKSAESEKAADETVKSDADANGSEDVQESVKRTYNLPGMESLKVLSSEFEAGNSQSIAGQVAHASAMAAASNAGNAANTANTNIPPVIYAVPVTSGAPIPQVVTPTPGAQVVYIIQPEEKAAPIYVGSHERSSASAGTNANPYADIVKHDKRK